MLQQFTLESNPPKLGNTLETALDKPMLLHVGGDGIIGRRVSMLRRHPLHSHQDPVLAEGIVGFNH